jgi:hypothetical protein
MFGRIGSGLTPPKNGLRSLWISVTRIRPPASRRGIQPAPAPYSGSTRIETSARLQRVEVDRPPDEPLVALERVEALDEPGRLGVGEGRRSIARRRSRAIAASMTAGSRRRPRRRSAP